MKFFIPGKTFLVGEYLVLHQGPALVALTGPAFFIQFFKKNGTLPGECSRFHPDSPAGKFIKKNSNYFENIVIEFEDRVLLGGLGASTAQFLAVYAWKQLVLGNRIEEISQVDLLDSYLECAYDGQGTPPSGADLIGQLKGLLCYFDKSVLPNEALACRKFQWPFDARLYLFHTGHKLATHEHLRQGIEFDSSGLRKSFDKAFEGIIEKDLALFCDGMNDYAGELEKLELTCDNSLRLINSIRTIPGVLAAKACGALGVDVVAVVCEQKNKLMEWAPKNGLKLLATDLDICEGLSYEQH